MKLAEHVIRQIHDTGPISFHDFMEACLYHPEMGYYTSSPEIIGKNGDFYTSATLTPVFGAIVAKQLEEMWAYMGSTAFTIVEYGAGTGDLCRSILDHLKNNERMYKELRYCIIEKSPVMCNQEAKHLTEKVEWYNSIQEIKEINGCVLSNELVDNFAIHRVVMQDELMEVFVDHQNGFSETLYPASAKLRNYFSELNVDLPRGYCAEINLQALDWMAEIASALKSGYVLTIDYGCQNSELYKASKSQGTLLCYHKHAVNDSPYDHIGEQDMTCHINFSALAHWGAKNGLESCGLTNQGYFLMSLGFREQLIKSFVNERDISKAASQVAAISNTLLLDMGSKYKVLIQQKGIQAEKLSGLAYCI
ncbi:MAG: SAM-dependent methyltransferase [Candidatus Pedobacter colombiensis]|uniref:SAM-dependent methyltransferase n=1 Tax=Candidatus Pedobacter colombiensis TaxID=3121371 RepID=A0AAJ5WCD1_9SPHI|nr:SAM-dependent methyltransferase [Pedobacter sp.]WEK21433.1 MAG: SAM-dependent methyltransferase [Pedobacter sp.]